MAKLTSRVWVGFDHKWGVIDILKSRRTKNPPEKKDHYTTAVNFEVEVLSLSGVAVSHITRGPVNRFVPATFSIDLDPPKGTQGVARASRCPLSGDVIFDDELAFLPEDFAAFFGEAAAAKVDGKRVKIRLERVR